TNGFKTGPDCGQFIKRCTARNSVDNGAEANKQCFDTFTRFTCFVSLIRKNCRYISAYDGHFVAKTLQCFLIGENLIRDSSNFRGALEQWCKGKAESKLDAAFPVLMSIALAGRAIFARNDPGFNQGGQMSAQCRLRHAMGTQRKLSIGWENDKAAFLLHFIIRQK